MSVIGDRMRELRGASSLREMADAIGIKYSAWARYENGDVLPGAEIISKICSVHACSADWLLGLDKSCHRGNFSVRASSGGIAIGGNVSGTVVGRNLATSQPRNPPNCLKCPFKAKLKALEKVMKK